MTTTAKGLLSAGRSQLWIIDAQERLVPAMHDTAAPEAIARVAQAARQFGVPVRITEQYPKGLGATVEAIAGSVPEQSGRFEKVTFDSLQTAAISDETAHLRAEGRDQLVLCGFEAHICVLQTAMSSLSRGFEVFVVEDGVSSRKPDSKSLARERLSIAGAQWVNSEMVMFEWAERAGTDGFRFVSRLVR